MKDIFAPTPPFKPTISLPLHCAWKKQQFKTALAIVSNELEAKLRKLLIPGVTLERLSTGEIRIRSGSLEWVGKIGDAPAKLADISLTAGGTQKQADTIRALKLQEVPRPKPID